MRCYNGAANMTRSAGSRLGPYEILAPLGAGGMGEVYRARDTRLGRDVAIKVLPAALAADPERRRRFEQEARAVSALNHPHICVLHDIGSQDGIDFLVMEYLDGQTLAQRLRRRKGGAEAPPLRLQEALEVGAQIADALATAHRHGIVHRDLKPANIMLVKTGAALQAKLLDFGLAKLRPQPGAAGAGLSELSTQAPATTPGAVMGTVPYMAPEQLEGKPTDARTDLFAFGCVLYEMLTARRAFGGDSQASVISAIMSSEPPPLSALQPLTPHALDRLVRRCLAKDPDDRWQDAADVAEELRGIAQDAVATEAVRAPAPNTVGVPRPPRPWRLWAAAAAGVVVFVGALLGGWIWRTATVATSIKSLAVLPLENLMGDRQQDFFVAGMTEELTAALSRISALRVPSRMSAAAAVSVVPKQSLPAIARALGVDAVIEGSVFRAGNLVRITVKLIQAKYDKVMWQGDYPGDLSDILKLQNEVARQVARAIQVQLTPEEQTRLTRARPVNPEAHLAYLQGRQAVQTMTQESLRKALNYFESAIQIDPKYAAAYAGVADAYYGFSNLYLSPREAMPKVKEAANRALALDESLAEAHVSLAWALMDYDRNFTGAEQHLRRAITLDANSANAHLTYSFLLVDLGRFDEAKAEVGRARELDPLSEYVTVYGSLPLYLARRYDEAAKNWEGCAVEHPDYYLVHAFLGLVYEQQRRLPQAVAEFERAAALEKDSSEPKAQLAHAYALSGRSREARKLLAELTEFAAHRYLSPYNIALIYLGLGDHAHALQALEESFEDRSEWCLYLKVDPRLDPLRSDPRFKDLLRRMKFPEVKSP